VEITEISTVNSIVADVIFEVIFSEFFYGLVSNYNDLIQLLLNKHHMLERRSENSILSHRKY
jgi:hypothetical protein